MRQKIWQLFGSFSERFLFFGRNSGIHGLNHLFRQNSSRLSRVFWMIILIASAGSLYVLLVPVAQLGVAVGFVPDTLYLNWTTTFPAVTICEEFIANSAQKRFVTKYPSLLDPLEFSFRRYLTSLVYFNPSCNTPRSREKCGDNIPCDLPWRIIVEDVHKKCTDLITECSYNHRPFSCCDVFRTVDSEHGPCYSFNTLQHENSDMNEPFVVNRTSGPGLLSFRLMSNAEISIHSTEELSTQDLNASFKKILRIIDHNRLNIVFSVVEIQNDPALLMEDIRVRNCRYLHEVPEKPFHTYSVYSYDACRLAEYTKHLFDKCGCVHPARDKSYEQLYCNYTGMTCLDCYEVQSIKNGQNIVVAEDACLQSCVESELTILHVFERSEYDPAPGALVNIQMNAVPTIRNFRYLLRNKLNLVVSVGGIVGLFTSASVLSGVEIPYLIFRSRGNHNA